LIRAFRVSPASRSQHFKTAIAKQNIKPGVKPAREIKSVNRPVSVNKGFLNRVQSVFSISQNSRRVTDCLMLVAFDEKPERILIAVNAIF